MLQLLLKSTSHNNFFKGEKILLVNFNYIFTTNKIYLSDDSLIQVDILHTNIKSMIYVYSLDVQNTMTEN